MEPHRLTLNPKGSRRDAFTIIELLAVMAIAAILFAMGGMMASGPIDSMKMTEAAQRLTSELARARQFAMTKNREVEFRIYETDPHQEGNIAFRSFDYGVIEAVTDPTDPDYEDPTSATFSPPFASATNGRSHLETGFVFLRTAPYSTLITGHSGADPNIRTGIEERRDGSATPYVSFTILPEGRAALDAEFDWTLTVVREADADREGSELKKNFVSVQVQPKSGRARAYRP